MELATADKAFMTARGEPIRSIIELRYALLVMSDDIFSKHVTAEKNDFSVWIRDVFHRNDIADAVQKQTTRQGIISILETYANQANAIKEFGVEQQTPDDLSMQAEKLKERINDIKEQSTQIKTIMGNDSYAVRVMRTQARFKGLREKITAARKAGHDLFVVEMQCQQIKPKFLYLEYGVHEEELGKINQLLDKLEAEIAEATAEPIFDIRKEMRAALGIPEKEE
ncbi:MAG: hypothetical protein V1725_05725 [archaeon]